VLSEPAGVLGSPLSQFLSYHTTRRHNQKPAPKLTVNSTASQPSKVGFYLAGLGRTRRRLAIAAQRLQPAPPFDYAQGIAHCIRFPNACSRLFFHAHNTIVQQSENLKQKQIINRMIF